MAESTGAHILVFPYPAQGHMIPLLHLTRQLSASGLTITILVTPKNLTFLDPLLSLHPSIKTLILPFPSHPSIPSGVENVRDLPASGFRSMMQALGQLYDPLLHWFQNHPSPPVAILSDFFLGWTHRLACQLGIRRFVFSPSGAMALSVIYYLWRYQPKLENPEDSKSPISFTKIPSSPIYPWWQLSPIYRSYVEGDPVSDFIKDGFLGNIASWGLVINSFTELERVYFNYLKEELGHDRVWGVGPVLPPDDDPSGSSTDLPVEILSFLDRSEDQTVVFVSFGSQAVLRNNQMEALALGLEQSGVKFIWAARGATKGHVEGDYGMAPAGFEERVAGRGLVIKGWAPQVSILRHRAVGGFLTHCGWNSVLEAMVAGVAMMTWPMGADQFPNASLLVDELKVAVRVCEGAETVPESDKLAQLVAKAMSNEKRVETARIMELLKKAALSAIKEGGSSYSDLDELVSRLSKEKM